VAYINFVLDNPAPFRSTLASMNTETTIRSWARGTDARIRVTRQNQDHTLDSRYPDVVPTVQIEMTLEADAHGRRPHLRVWIPLARRTPLFAFGPDAQKPGETDIDATFPSFDDDGGLVGALQKVRGDFLARYALPVTAKRKGFRP
jgi:hypothetical protein